MKFLIASDIHGSAYYCEQLLQAFEREQAARLLLLGDILYHGPRNDLPRDYAPKKVIAMLNGMADIILCVRGNCDTEVDQMVLEFPILADYAVLPTGERLVYVTHGHQFNTKTPPPLCQGDVLLHGKRAPQVGRICMDMCMVDVTDIPEVQPGDVATIFGRDLSVAEQAEKAGTIPYELLCAMSQRVQRVYID